MGSRYARNSHWLRKLVFSPESHPCSPFWISWMISVAGPPLGPPAADCQTFTPIAALPPLPTDICGFNSFAINEARRRFLQLSASAAFYTFRDRPSYLLPADLTAHELPHFGFWLPTLSTAVCDFDTFAMHAARRRFPRLSTAFVTEPLPADLTTREMSIFRCCLTSPTVALGTSSQILDPVRLSTSWFTSSVHANPCLLNLFISRSIDYRIEFGANGTALMTDEP
jgi:hypothetical protein